MLEHPPRDETEVLLREQSIGEIRGLKRLARLTELEINDLRQQLAENP